MTAKPAATLNQVMELIREGQTAARDRHEDLKADFEQKHNDNKDRRHALANQVAAGEGRLTLVEGRVAVVETKLVPILGDNSGGSGLLHEIDRKVDSLTGEVAAIKKTVEDTPAINRWIYGAMGIVGLLVFGIPLVIVVIIEIIKYMGKH